MLGHQETGDLLDDQIFLGCDLMTDFACLVILAFKIDDQHRECKIGGGAYFS